MADMFTYNVELIEKFKKKLIRSTNIETSTEEMKVIDNILFRFWQMGWLDKLDSESLSGWISVTKRPPEIGEDVLICDIDGDIYLTHMTRYKEFYDYFGNHIKNVCAWMSLPEPYKKEGEQDGNK